MKKILILLLSLLSTALLAGCVVVNTPPVVISTYSITFTNNTNYYVTDWYVKNHNDTKFALDIYNCPVPSGSNSTLSGLATGYYKIMFSIDSFCRVYETSDGIWLDENVEYVLSQRVVVRPRSAGEAGETEESKVFVLLGSDGSEVELTALASDHLSMEK